MGASVHYSGTIPMSTSGRPFTVSKHCRSSDFSNLYIVDGTTMPFGLVARAHPALVYPASGLRLGLPLVAALFLFTVAFGLRRVRPTERHPGMVAALVVECVVKLGAFLAIGAFVVFGIFDGTLLPRDDGPLQEQPSSAGDSHQVRVCCIQLSEADAAAECLRRANGGLSHESFVQCLDLLQRIKRPRPCLGQSWAGKTCEVRPTPTRAARPVHHRGGL